MYRGTTPTVAIILPIDAKQVTTCYVTFAQFHREVFTKQLSDCTIKENDSKILYLKLSQQDTLSLQCSCDVDIQVRCKLEDGTTLASRPVSLPVDEIYMEGEI